MGTDIIGIKLLYVLSFFFCVNGRGLGLASSGANGVQMLERSPAELKGANTHLFNVRSFGAQADGHTDDRRVCSCHFSSSCFAFTAAWKEACASTGKVKLLIPKGTYMIGPITFAEINLQGYLKATTDLSEYGFSAGWIEFGWMKGLTLTGGGTFDGQGVEAWPYNKCPINANCKLLPTNLKFIAMNKTVVRGITSVNSKFFHIALVECNNFKGSQIKISAPENSPNTDGIHMSEALAFIFLDPLLVLATTASLLDKEILKSLSQASLVDLAMASGTAISIFLIIILCLFKQLYLTFGFIFQCWKLGKIS
ncbi:Exopolygalacturonase [Vitis vinifera]|uniref:Exopolygalacturonase n=1 Tax=Vitis vinifera TaxID=29760 RepID=A0A438JT16_VITVI|nr:Exopolygalacturonase [Vitis vinifera]